MPKETLKLPKRWYSHQKYRSPISDEELKQRLAMIPEDTRDLTGRWMGDPYPNDERRPKCNDSEDVSYVDELV